MLFVLVATVGVTGFLAATTHADAMVYAFAFSFVSLCGYCYKLVQIRSLEMDHGFRHRVGQNDLSDQLGLAFGNGPGLVQRDGLELAGFFEVDAALDEDAAPRRCR